MLICYKPLWEEKMKSAVAPWFGGGVMDFAMVRLDARPAGSKTWTFRGFVTTVLAGDIGEDWRVQFAILPPETVGQVARVRGRVSLCARGGVTIMTQSHGGGIYRPDLHSRETKDLQPMIAEPYSIYSFPKASSGQVERARQILHIAVSAVVLFEYCLA